MEKKCNRCGDCCRSGPPALHLEDIDIYRNGQIKKKHLITHRKGEYIYDNVIDAMVVLDQEIVKIKSKPQKKECLFLNSCDCTIYPFRPKECRVFKCWDIREYLNFYSNKRATRLDLIPKDSALAEIIVEHEKRCPVDRLLKLIDEFKEKKDKDTLKEIHTIYDQDEFFRDYLIKAGATEEDLDFIFGRRVADFIPPEIKSLLDI